MVIKNILAIFVALLYLALAMYLIHSFDISGAEFVSLLGLGMFTSVLISLGDKIQSLSLGGNVVQLKRENERAESNIERLDELACAISESLIISSPGFYENDVEKGYREGVDFVNRYRLFYRLQRQATFPLERVELAVRKYLYHTHIGIRYKAMYDDTHDIPSPAQLLSNFTNDRQRIKVAKSRYFQFYQSDIYPIYVDSVSRQLKSGA